MAIPVVDLSEFIGGDSTSKAKFSKELGKAYEDVGFVVVKNHGIPGQLIDKLYRRVKEFFSLPLDKKLQYEIVGLAGQRGYTSFGREHAKGSQMPDLKEFFQYGQNVEDEDPIKTQYPDNVKVNEVIGFDETISQAYKHFERSGIAIFKPLLYTLVLIKIFSANMFITVIVFYAAFIIRRY